MESASESDPTTASEESLVARHDEQVPLIEEGLNGAGHESTVRVRKRDRISYWPRPTKGRPRERNDCTIAPLLPNRHGGQQRGDKPEPLPKRLGLNAREHRYRSVASGEAPRDRQRQRIRVVLHVEADRGVKRGSELVGEEDGRLDRVLVIERALVESPALEDQQRGGEVGLELELLLGLAEEPLLVVEVVARLVPRDQPVACLMCLGEPFPPGRLVRSTNAVSLLYR